MAKGGRGEGDDPAFVALTQDLQSSSLLIKSGPLCGDQFILAAPCKLGSAYQGAKLCRGGRDDSFNVFVAG